MAESPQGWSEDGNHGPGGAEPPGLFKFRLQAGAPRWVAKAVRA